MTALAPDLLWRVGDALPVLPVEPVSRTTLALFAGGSGDHNPIHLDVDVARAAGMDDVFAQGMLSMAYLGRLVTDVFPQAQLRSLRSRFLALTPVGAAPTCHGEVVAIEGRQLTLELRVVLQDGTTTLSGQAVVDVESPAAGA